MVSKNWPERPVDNESFRPPPTRYKIIIIIILTFIAIEKEISMILLLGGAPGRPTGG